MLEPAERVFALEPTAILGQLSWNARRVVVASDGDIRQLVERPSNQRRRTGGGFWSKKAISSLRVDLGLGVVAGALQDGDGGGLDPSVPSKAILEAWADQIRHRGPVERRMVPARGPTSARQQRVH